MCTYDFVAGMLVALHTQMEDIFRAIEKVVQEGTHCSCTREASWSESRGVGYLIPEAATARRSERSYRGPYPSWQPASGFLRPYLFPRLS